MTIEEFEEMLVGDFFLKLFYFNEARNEKDRYLGELLRMQTMLLLNIQVEQQSRLKNPQDLWKFGWEEDGEAHGHNEIMTDEHKMERVRNLLSIAEQYL